MDSAGGEQRCDAWWFLVLTVGAGELISCGLLGLLLWKTAQRIPQIRGMQ